jgi:hypothetical protein
MTKILMEKFRSINSKFKLIIIISIVFRYYDDSHNCLLLTLRLYASIISINFINPF